MNKEERKIIDLLTALVCKQCMEVSKDFLFDIRDITKNLNTK